MCVSLGGASAAIVASRFSWKERQLAASGVPVVGGVDCPTERFCVAFDGYGRVLTSTDPSSRARAWTIAKVEPPPSPIDGVPSQWHGGISCPGRSLCVAIDRAGNLIASRAPASAARTWRPIDLPSNGGFSAVSCPNRSLCVAVDLGGDVATSTDPAAGSAAWRVAHLDHFTVGCPGGLDSPQPVSCATSFGGVSCPSAKLCVAADDAGYVFSSTDPRNGRRTWKATKIASAVTAGSYSTGANGVTVYSTPWSWCFVGEEPDIPPGPGDVFVSSHPSGGTTAWHAANLHGHVPALAACASHSLCLVFQGEDLFTSVNPTAHGAAWNHTQVPFALGALSCPSPTLCVGFSGGTVFIGTHNPRAK